MLGNNYSKEEILTRVSIWSTIFA